MLLYCTANYPGHSLEIPGLGVVLNVDRTVEYRWVPFAESIPKAHLDSSFDPEDAAKLKNVRFDAFWLFEISRQSFCKTVSNRVMAWENL
jgi:hypothetical protein